MGKRFDRLSDRHTDFIARQHIFFVGTAGRDGRVNLSPKGHDSLRVMGPNRVCWLNLTGSGNETAAHLLDMDRMTLMFCAFEGDPMILRLYGTARAVHPRDGEWQGLIGLFPTIPGARQVIDMRVDLVQTSCGFAVPRFDFVADRETLVDWAKKRGQKGIGDYWAKNNTENIDGKPTGIVKPEDNA